MKINFGFLFFLLSAIAVYSNAQNNQSLERSYFKLTTSNGLIVAVYNMQGNRIDYVYPHIFANYDSGKYVHPFAGNILLNSSEQPLQTSYLNNTHIIISRYKNFSIHYLSSFTKSDKIFYIVIRGEKNKITNLNFLAETGKGKAVSHITQLENPLEDLPIYIGADIITGTFIRHYKNNIYEKYFLYSFTDSLHTDKSIITRTINQLKKANTSLLDDEYAFMRKRISQCKIPANLSAKEKNIVEQSIALLKMSQVADNEIFPLAKGQILASLRPGLWHIAWVRDGSYAIQAMTRLGLYAEAKKGLEFMLKAKANRFKNYWYNGKNYGPGVDYQISLTRYFGNGEEECDYNEFGPNIEYDDWGLFLIAFCDYVNRSKDQQFYQTWKQLVQTRVADAIVSIIDKNDLIKEDSGPWEHHLQLTRQYTFTSGVCARALELFADLQKRFAFPFEQYNAAATRLKKGLLTHMLCEGKFFKGNVNDTLPTAHEFYDAGVYEIFANGLITDPKLFQSHMEAYDKVLRIKGERPGYIRLNSDDPYENQEWVFINLRIANAYLLFHNKPAASLLLNHVTEMAAVNNNIIPEMYSNKLQMEKVDPAYMDGNIWCNCIRTKDDQYIGTIPMIGYGSGAYILSLFDYYEK